MLDISQDVMHYSGSSEPTLFSQARFLDILTRSIGNCRPVELIAKSNSSMVGAETVHSFGRRSISFCPFGLYAHPAGINDLGETVRTFVGQLRAFRTTSFDWNVRFDHELLAGELAKLGIQHKRTRTHVLRLGLNYQATVKSYHAAASKNIRRADRAGVFVRAARSLEDVREYYKIHTKLAATKGNYGSLYPVKLFEALIDLEHDVIFLVAQFKKKLIGGGWFFRDGHTIMYWHGAMDPEYSKYEPGYATIDCAIRLAHDDGRHYFNFGGSSGITSLEQFKAMWGARPEYCWRFVWRNPMWQTLHDVKHRWAHA